MIVVNISNGPPKLRGFLSKYLWEIDAGVYVGNVNARIREALWSRIIDNKEAGHATMVFPSNNEQGFEFYTSGSAWIPVDFEGLKLILRSDRKQERTNIAQYKPDRYVVLDLETTGLDIENDRILEIGAMRVINGEVSEQFNRMIKNNVPNDITTLTGITQEMANGGVDIKVALEDLGMFIADDMVIGYNIRGFDLKIIKKECLRNNTFFPLKQITDVFETVKRRKTGLKSYKLRDIAEYFGISVDNKLHRAMVDCVLCNEIYRHMI